MVIEGMGHLDEAMHTCHTLANSIQNSSTIYEVLGMLSLSGIIVLLLLTLSSTLAAQGETCLIDRIPDNYQLYSYDDCGVEGRQPHVKMDDCYLYTFTTADTEADLKYRSAVLSYKQLNLVYDDLDPKLSYALALTYPNDKTYNRIQSLWANGVELHGPRILPKGKVTKVMVSVPSSVTKDGKMHLEIKINGEVNATLSVIELWSSGPSKSNQNRLHLGFISALPDGIAGNLTDITYEPKVGAEISLIQPSTGRILATTTTDAKGLYRIANKAFESLIPKETLDIEATDGNVKVRRGVPIEHQSFEPIRYRPIPAKVAGLKNHTLSLDGIWRIKSTPDAMARQQPLNAEGWSNFKVPGQWVQQGFAIPLEKSVAVSREFTIPKEWAGFRIMLRFDAIHAGTHYWLNGKPLGYSENLFTPVEWEITDLVKPEAMNRLDLDMAADTVSEKLSCSSSYCNHSLGGIDRAVSLYALPTVNISQMNISTTLDSDYRDGNLQLNLGVNNQMGASATGVEAVATLFDAKGKRVGHFNLSNSLTNLKPGLNSINIESSVTKPRKWNAEQPYLYKLVVELRKDGNTLERVERSIAFRKIEIKDRQLLVNGMKVKLAGVCRHEIDPLTGRSATMKHGEADVKLFKEANLNYIRTSHYPPTQEFLDACDRIGMYVECEAPLCWVAPSEDLKDLNAILSPTSAMIDFCHTHPSIILWSVANESAANTTLDYSAEMIRSLDPTRLVTASGPSADTQSVDIANWHYPGYNFEDVSKDDPRALLIDETFFLVYHERTDVTIDPGLRELWGHGSADPKSEWGKLCDASYRRPGMLTPGIYPGAWSEVVASKHIFGTTIWSGVDDTTYMPDGSPRSSENNNAYWGLIDGWRRKKPEWWISRMVFSPVWFPVRQVEYKKGQSLVSIPVENRYSFTNLSKLTFTWELGGVKGKIAASVAPFTAGNLKVSVPSGTPTGSQMTLRVTDAAGILINAPTITLGQPEIHPLPKPDAGAPKWTADGSSIFIDGNGFSLVIDKAKGDFDAASPKHNAPIVHFPMLHITRREYGDLVQGAPPYSLFPDASTRVVDSVTVSKTPKGLEITVSDHYTDFAGDICLLIDKHGIAKVTSNYTYTGDGLNAREVGVMAVLKPECAEVRWRRWSEWGDAAFSKDSISRTAGSAKAHRDKKWPPSPANVKPDWSWSQDETELGTADFRSIRFNIYQASIAAPNGSGIRVNTNGDRHFRSCLTDHGVKMHILTDCPLGEVKLKKGDKISGEFTIEILHQ